MTVRGWGVERMRRVCSVGAAAESSATRSNSLVLCFNGIALLCSRIRIIMHPASQS